MVLIPDHFNTMSRRNDYSQHRGRNFNRSTASRHETKYHKRGGKGNFRPEPNRPPISSDDVHSLTMSIDRHLTTDGNSSQDVFFTDRSVKHTKNHRPSREIYKPLASQKGWWRITVSEAGTIGKQLVMEAIQAKCARPFHPYHVIAPSSGKFQF